MNPSFGIPIIVDYGSAESTGGAPPAINNTLTGALRASQIGPPNVASLTRLPIIERVTPRSMNAGKSIRTNTAKVRTRVTTMAGTFVNFAKGYANTIRSHR